MSNSADFVNVPFEAIEHKGKKYQLKELTIEERAKFARWLEQRAYESVGRGIAHLPDSTHGAFYSAVVRDIAAGVYEWGGEACMTALGTIHGSGKVLHIAFGEANDIPYEECVEIILKRIADNMSDELKATIERMLADPKN